MKQNLFSVYECHIRNDHCYSTREQDQMGSPLSKHNIRDVTTDNVPGTPLQYRRPSLLRSYQNHHRRYELYIHAAVHPTQPPNLLHRLDTELRSSV
eukprot:EST45436.1 Hypothetical protein SS50377_14629 [Spironucleus salmonicida]